MVNSTELQMAIAKAMLEKEPGLLTANVQTSVECAHALAANLGCVMASMLAKEGETKFEAALQTILVTVRKHAHGTVRVAQEMGRDPTIGTMQ